MKKVNDKNEKHGNEKKGNEGIGLISMMVQLSVLSILIVGGSAQMAVHAKMNKGALVQAEVNSYLIKISASLTNQTICTNAIGGESLANGLTVYDPASSSQALASTNDSFSGWSVPLLQIANVQDVEGIDGLKRGTFQVTVAKVPGAVFNAKTRVLDVADVYFTTQDIEGDESVDICYGTLYSGGN